jgi:heat shock protein HtpX
MNLKRIGLFILTNILVILVLSIVLSVLGVNGYIEEQGINFTALLIFSAVFGFGGAFISLAISRWMAKMAMGVRVIDPNGSMSEEERWLVQTVHAQCRRAGLDTMPEVGIYDSPEVNAFATGPSKKKSLVAVSSGLMQVMTRDETEGVLAHEVAHIANGDMVTMTLLQGVINTFVIFLSRVLAFAVSRFVDEKIAGIVHFVCVIVFQIVFGILGSMVVMSFSRYREFHADAGSARISGKDKMIAALEKLRTHHAAIDNGHPAMATMKIAGSAGIMALLSSHPPLEQRIEVLRRSEI